jgi:serine O-acetyltransferase
MSKAQKVCENNISTIRLIRSDLLRYHSLSRSHLVARSNGLSLWLGLFSPRLLPVLIYRISHGLYRHHLFPLAKAFSFINHFLFGIEIASACPIGPGLFFPHPQGCVIGAWSIGSNAIIFQGVTLGARELDFNLSQATRPTIGNDVTIGAGAKVLGGVILGDHCCVGANSVVLMDLPNASLAVGAPARIVLKKGEKCN